MRRAGQGRAQGHSPWSSDPGIPAGTVVSRLGGRLVSTAGLTAIFKAAASDPDHPYIDTITVDEDLHLVLPSRQASAYGNHSCDPNLWWIDAYSLAARRDIASGEEVTNDYATSAGIPEIPEFRMACACGSPACRTVISGNDWRRPALQQRYGDHWTPGLLRRIQDAR